MRCLTIVLACGWLLLAPPDEKELETGKPSLEWLHLGSYDTARDCETAKSALLASLAKKQRTDKTLLTRLVAYSNSRCVPSDLLSKPG